MSKMFEKWVDKRTARDCHDFCIDCCEEAWNESEKATEKRVIDEVIEIAKACSFGVEKGYCYFDAIGVQKLEQVLKRKYGVSDDGQNQKAH